MKKIDIMGTRIDNVTMDEAVNACEKKIASGEQYIIYTPNTEFVMMARKDEEFKNLLNKSDLNIPDGIGLIYAAKIKKHPLKEKVAGYDLTVNLIRLANQKKLKIYFVGGKPGIAGRAAQNIKNDFPDINIVGISDGYFKGTHLDIQGHEEEKRLIDDINNKAPDILFVGFGAKKQEKWIEYNKGLISTKIIVGNGGTVDGLAGEVKRAPDIYIKLGLEWFYRLMKEPKRIKRQMLLPKFMLKVIFSGRDIIKEIE